MIISVSLTEDMIFDTLKAALQAVLPAGVEAIKSQENRIPETKSEDFVMMTPTNRKRLATNQDIDLDVLFTGSIAGKTLTVSAVNYGKIGVGNQIFGAGVSDNTTIQSQLTGSPAGGIGTYALNIAQTVASRSLAAGTHAMVQETEISVQIDVHGPDSANNSQIISTIFRDSYGYDLFNPDVSGLSPLYADDPKQMPFTNEEQQVENRWVIAAEMQADISVLVPQQFAQTLTVGLIEVEATYAQ